MTELFQHPPALRNAASMVASELLENAIKYGEGVPDAPTIEFSFTLEAGQILIVVRNGATLESNVRRLQEHIEALNRAEDRSSLYLLRLEELLEQPAQNSGLGVYRIGYEGEFDLECTYVDRVVTVTASRSIR
ncbi:MAG: hypothetical protein JW751_29285 [Polyangiaceae bacterium]|nr:hypothetical protein [Polyangiaceae bacterium]